MKDGLIIENGVPTYYEDGKPVHKGIVQDGEDIYYIGKNGVAVKGRKYVHSSMTHHIVKHGTYKFGSDYKMKQGYFKERKSKKKKSLWKKVKKDLKDSSYKNYTKAEKTFVKVIVILVAVLLLVFAAVGIISAVKNNRPHSDTPSTEPVVRDVLSVTVGEIPDEVWLVSDEAKKIYTDGGNIKSVKSYPYKPFEFNYYVRCSEPALADDVTAVLYLCEDSSMKNAAEYQADPYEGTLTVDNLKVATEYFYKFEVSVSDETHVSEGSFRTAETHRLLSLPNLSNVRDVGGRMTADGRRIRQNMIIRGSEADGLVEPEYFLLNDYVDYVRENFGFRSDLDLRSMVIGYSEYSSRFGIDVKHSFFEAPSYTEAIMDANKKSINNIFSFLAEKSNYPIYLHCTYGRDRTGTIVYLLDAILGLSEDEMNMEYELSTGVSAMNFLPLKNALESYEGDTINKKIENFLITRVGVTPEEIASIRSIMLEG